MFLTLLKSRLTGMFASQFQRNKGKKKTGSGVIKKVLIGLLVLYVLACFLFLFGMNFYAICGAFIQLGMSWVYFAMVGISAAALCFIGSIFLAEQQIFEAKDNDMLLAMPIPPRHILGSRMVALLLINYAYALIVIVPAIVVWCMYSTMTAVQIIAFLVCALLLPVLILAVSCVFGWLLALINQRMRNKSLVTMILSILFLVAYFGFIFKMNNYLAYIVANGEAIGGAIKGYIYPAYIFGVAIAEGDLVSTLIFALICLAPFALIYLILSRTFIRVVTMKRGAAKIKYRERELKAGSQSSALLRKELRHFFGNGMYVLNAGLGSVFTIICAVLLVIYRDGVREFIAMISGFEAYAGAAFVAGLCLMNSLDIISAPSISMEGKNLWILKSMPVQPGTVLMSKVNTHLAVALPPVLLTSIAAIIVLKPGLLIGVGIIAAPALTCLLGALLGVVVNLSFPKLDFVNETMVVKQSASVMITMFAGMGVVLVPTLAYVFLLRGFLAADVFILICSVLLAAACFLMHRYLYRGGTKKFLAL